MMELTVLLYGVLFGVGIGLGVLIWDVIFENVKKFAGRYVHIG